MPLCHGVAGTPALDNGESLQVYLDGLEPVPFHVPCREDKAVLPHVVAVGENAVVHPVALLGELGDGKEGSYEDPAVGHGEREETPFLRPVTLLPYPGGLPFLLQSPFAVGTLFLFDRPVVSRSQIGGADIEGRSDVLAKEEKCVHHVEPQVGGLDRVSVAYADVHRLLVGDSVETSYAGVLQQRDLPCLQKELAVAVRQYPYCESGGCEIKEIPVESVPFQSRDVSSVRVDVVGVDVIDGRSVASDRAFDAHVGGKDPLVAVVACRRAPCENGLLAGRVYPVLNDLSVGNVEVHPFAGDLRDKEMSEHLVLLADGHDGEVEFLALLGSVRRGQIKLLAAKWADHPAVRCKSADKRFGLFWERESALSAPRMFPVDVAFRHAHFPVQPEHLSCRKVRKGSAQSGDPQFLFSLRCHVCQNKVSCLGL